MDLQRPAPPTTGRHRYLNPGPGRGRAGLRIIGLALRGTSRRSPEQAPPGAAATLPAPRQDPAPPPPPLETAGEDPPKTTLPTQAPAAARKDRPKLVKRPVRAAKTMPVPF